jgi:quercetin dioxygenase-like cupin family protein
MPAITRRAASVAALSLCATFGTATLLADAPPSASGKLSFIRLYTSADGNSHFADETIPLSPIKRPGLEGQLAASEIGDVKGATFLALKPGQTEPYHVAPRRQFMICLRGIVEVTAGDGEKRRILPGQFVLLEDTSGKGHITHSAGTEDHVALAFPIPDNVFVNALRAASEPGLPKRNTYERQPAAVPRDTANALKSVVRPDGLPPQQN